MRGDASDTFTFASFFPDVMQPPVTFVADRIYEALVAMKLCTPFSAEEIATSNENAMARGQAGLPSLLSSSRSAGGFRSMAKREEAERRQGDFVLAAIAFSHCSQLTCTASATHITTSSVPTTTAETGDSSSLANYTSSVTPSCKPGSSARASKASKAGASSLSTPAAKSSPYTAW